MEPSLVVAPPRSASLEPLILEPLRPFHRLPASEEVQEGDADLDDWFTIPDGTLLTQSSWDEYDALSDDEEDPAETDDTKGGEGEKEDDCSMDITSATGGEAAVSKDVELSNGEIKTNEGKEEEEEAAAEYYVRLQSGQFRRIHESEKDWHRRQRLEQELYDGDRNCVRQFPLMRDMFRLGEEYQFHNCLSNDGNTAVYSARQRSTGYPVVLKITKHRFIHDQPRELSLLAKVQGHPNLPRVLGWHPLPETRSAAIVMDMLHKDSIPRSVFRKQDRIRTFMHQLLSAVAFVHAQKIIHRDLKMGNIVWDDERAHLILIDFDIATFFYPESHRYTRRVGTDGFIAPEVGEAPSYDQKVDVFSAGVIMAQLIYGVRESNVLTNQSHRRSASGFRRRAALKLRSIPPTSCKRYTLELMRALLQKDPTQRPTAEQALTSPFFTHQQ